MRHKRPLRHGFTLIEIMIVVVVLGILATIVIASMSQGSEEAQRTTFATSGRVLVDACQRYHFKTGTWPEDASSGVVPAGLEDYLIEEQWVAGTPIGGVWDTEYNSYGVTAAVGVHFDGTGQTRDDVYMADIDAMVDDGNLNTGGFRKIAANRYYFVMAN